MNFQEYTQLMQTVADGWNEGNAHKAAECFTADAIYAEPPQEQLYHGRAELFEFFGGNAGPEIPMQMTWHHLAFHEEQQIGFGEYTFQMHRRYHGIVIVKIEAERIKHWREYQYPSELTWADFTKHNPF